MRWSDIPWSPPARTLRQFAGLWLAFFGALAIWQRVGHDRPLLAGILGAVAVVGGGVGLLWPAAIRPVYAGWMAAVFPIGWTVALVVLGLVYFGVVTPLALWFRLLRRDPLQRRRDPQRASYWMPKAAPTDPGRYLRPY